MPGPLPNDIREIIAEDLAAGMTHQEIADDLDISRSAVTRIAQHIKKYGTHFPKKSPGRPPTLSKEDHAIVEKIVLENPKCTLEQYADLIADKTGKRRLKKSRVHEILRKLGLSFKKTEKYASEQDREDVKKKFSDYIPSLEEGINKGDITPENTIFIDESGIDQNGAIQKTWSPVGKPTLVSEPKSRTPNTTIVGAISGLGVLSAMYCQCSYDRFSFEAFIEEHLGVHLGPGKFVIMDNVPIHHVTHIKKLIESTGARVVFLPQYHPELNPIEMMWEKIKPSIRKLVHKGMSFKAAIRESLELVSDDDCLNWLEHCGVSK